MIEFPISGVETYWWLPMLVAFGISCFTSMAGVSGAFLILPFQISVLRFTGPAVSPTNLVYNIVAIPSGVYRYRREKRMIWPLAWTIIAGGVPGVCLGAMIRIKYLPDARTFKMFAGLVLLYVGVRLLFDLLNRQKMQAPIDITGDQFKVTSIKANLRRIAYKFNGESYQASTAVLVSMSLIVGIIGGTYGIGGGCMIAPFLIGVYRLPVHTIAGAVLMGTFMTSIVGVAFYAIIAPFYSGTGLAISPDWMLGAMFGIGGAAGMYVGARLQRFMPSNVIKIILVVCIFFIAIKYITGFFI